jgi:hypothetical protein
MNGIIRPGDRLLVEPVSPIMWRTVDAITVRIGIAEFVIPAGYVTDFATVPRVAVWLIPRFGSYTIAAIFHDWLLTHELPAGRVTAVEADRLFRLALRALKVPPFRRALMWTGVRWGAAFSKRRRAEWWSTFPEVLAGTVAAVSTVVIPVAMIAVALALAVYGVIEFIASSLSPKDETTSGSLST